MEEIQVMNMPRMCVTNPARAQLVIRESMEKLKKELKKCMTKMPSGSILTPGVTNFVLKNAHILKDFRLFKRGQWVFIRFTEPTGYSIMMKMTYSKYYTYVNDGADGVRVSCSEMDTFDPLIGVAMAIYKYELSQEGRGFRRMKDALNGTMDLAMHETLIDFSIDPIREHVMESEGPALEEEMREMQEKKPESPAEPEGETESKEDPAPDDNMPPEEPPSEGGKG